MDHAAIFTTILRRNALRREARLPLLDVRAEYQEEVATAHQHEIYEQHYDVVRAEVVERLREEREPGWEGTEGGRWLLDVLVRRELRQRFPLPKRWSQK